jgi:PH/SEC7 domain-containing protein
MNKWIDAINLVAASFSSPPLPAAIDSVSLRFQRPLLPSVQTRYSVVSEFHSKENQGLWVLFSLNNMILLFIKSIK